MPMRSLALVAASLLVSACATSAPQQVSWAQIMAQPQPADGERISYGSAPAQFGELRLPGGRGPFALAVLIHGGCWRAEYGLDHIAALAADLNEQGVATWAIEYRRLGETGGGWPGTFDDVVAGLARLESIANERPIDLDRMVLVGHSAGGHLALWLASRQQLPQDHRWHGRLPEGVRGVVGLAAITGLAEYASGSGACNAAVPMLLGEDSSRLADRLGLGSPDRLLPPAVAVHLVHGREDRIVPVSQSERYAEQVRRAGGRAEQTVVSGAGHFDLIAPFAHAWPRVRSVIIEALEAK